MSELTDKARSYAARGLLAGPDLLIPLADRIDKLETGLWVIANFVEVQAGPHADAYRLGYVLGLHECANLAKRASDE